MHIDFAIIDIEKNETEIKELVNQILAEPIKVKSIACSYFYLKSIKNILSQYPELKVNLSCMIDFPCGVSDSKTRLSAIEQAYKAGADTVDIVMPQNLASNRKYDKIREDTRILTDYTREKSINTRYILEYRVFDHHCLKKMCEILDGFNVTEIFPSSCYFLDNLADNLIASVFLHDNSKNINIYCTGNAWNNNHFNIIQKTGLYGIRVLSIFALKNLVKILIEKQKNTQ